MTSIRFAPGKFTGLPFLLITVFLLNFSVLHAQTDGLPFQKIHLNNLEAFSSPPSNWVLAGDIYMDLNTRHHIHPENGTGILVNTNQGDQRADLYTAWEHGDIDLDLEFMMARQSNSGIYFQGMYELQLLDSWGVENPTFSDMGGIYEGWEDDRGFGGVAPRANASRAPGLWQRLEVKFRAPRFHANGEKIANARFEKVTLNGVVIHEQVELPHPTRGAMQARETAAGPLRIQGDHGPIAFRNIQYKAYNRNSIALGEINYRYYEGDFETAADIRQASPVREGKTEQLSLAMLKTTGNFAVVYTGHIHAEEAGDYFFELRSDGGNRLTVAGNTLIENGDAFRWESDRTTVSLSRGQHPFELVYFRENRGGQPVLALHAEGPGIHRHALQDAASFPAGQAPIPLLIRPADEPVVQHGFLDVKGKVHPHSVAVGYPGGVHFARDQNSGSILKFWKGDFINAASMWVGRGGNNLSLNENAAITKNGGPPFSRLQTASAAWPDSLPQNMDYQFYNYRHHPEGHVSFSYRYGQVHIEDTAVPQNDNKELKRTLLIKTSETPDRFYFRIANGNDISLLPNNLYQVNGKTYYISLDEETAAGAFIRQAGGGQELLVPVNSSQQILSYSYIW